MKKIIVISALIGLLLFPSLSHAKRLSPLEKVISIIIPAGLSIWAFNQNSRYGNTTGILFSIKALIRLFDNE